MQWGFFSGSIQITNLEGFMVSILRLLHMHEVIHVRHFFYPQTYTPVSLTTHTYAQTERLYETTYQAIMHMAGKSDPV